MTAAKLLSLLLWLESPARPTAAAAAAAGASADGSIDDSASPGTPRRRSLSRARFSRILHTALDDEATLQHLRADDETIEDDNLRRLQALPSREVAFNEHDAWARMVQHGWDWGKRPHRRSRQRRNLRSGRVVKIIGGRGQLSLCCVQ